MHLTLHIGSSSVRIDSLANVKSVQADIGTPAFGSGRPRSRSTSAYLYQSTNTNGEAPQMAAPRFLYYVRRFIVAISVANPADDPTEYFAIYHHPLDPTS